MGRKSYIEGLDPHVRAELDRRLIDGNFSGYEQLAKEMRERGFVKVGKSALHRYGQAMERRLQLDRTADELTAMGIGAELAAELAGQSTLVVVIDRRNQRARLISVPAPAPAVIDAIKQIGKSA
jgi:hypothetical protein